MRSDPKSNIKVLTTLLTALPDKQGEFLQTLRILQEEIRQQPGCLECTVGQDVSGGPRFLLFTVWEELPYLEVHMDSEAFRVLLGAASILTAPAGYRFISADSAFPRQMTQGEGHRPATRRVLPAS